MTGRLGLIVARHWRSHCAIGVLRVVEQKRRWSDVLVALYHFMQKGHSLALLRQPFGFFV